MIKSSYIYKYQVLLKVYSRQLSILMLDFRRIARPFLVKFRNPMRTSITFSNKEFSTRIRYVRRDE